MSLLHQGADYGHLVWKDFILHIGGSNTVPEQTDTCITRNAGEGQIPNSLRVMILV